MSVFVTVGSTSFDNLIKVATSENVLHVLKSKGFNKVVLQIGRGTVLPEKSSILEIEWFKYKDSLADDIKSASLVIGHAGAGTILESLIEQKPLITVFNETLMNNHQSELAEQMEKDGFLISCSTDKLLKTLENFDSKKLKTYMSDQNRFPAFLHEIMGFR
ncbi:UDP-N-acetylglucosamine transferase subunit ALG13 [Parasteatoda tepidariorum]|uniref:UDP-N-acetylglucosamine transferase subunit ALG13 n=1 Tax=Parasteatoda tepidariorum TaxID=114398 RepID=UPI00077FBF20|nr:UDP-N-acetylglucosamine transferase subunit ALG13 homolog [Parasteatoda tepidariorum]